MDFSPLLTVVIDVIAQYGYLIILPILISLFTTSWFKGILGEFMVNLCAYWQLDNDVYRLFRNVTLATKDGTTQIDHIIVSVYGVFVIETKNLKGWIFGNPHQKIWTQQIYKHKSKFQNPLHQNYKHTKTLQSLLALEDEQIHSVVVFVGDSTFKSPMPDNVTFGMGYIRYIQSKTDRVLSPRQVLDAIKTIESQRLSRTIKNHRAHAKHVKQIITEKTSE